MSTEAASASESPRTEAKYLAAIEDCLREMSERRKKMKETDMIIRQLRAANRRQVNELRSVLRRVQAAV